MYAVPEHFAAVSVRLSAVLDDIGLSQRMVLRRRGTSTRMETMETMMHNLQLGETMSVAVYYFGSQSEGSTTVGLKSDIDSLHCLDYVNVIQNMSEWVQCVGATHLLMVQDERTAPGYCRLQLLRPDVPFPEKDPQHDHYVLDHSMRVVMKNTLIHQTSSEVIIQGPSTSARNRHGPANTDDGQLGKTDRDEVYAFRCSSWKPDERLSLRRQREGHCQTSFHSKDNGCFLVPVGHPRSEDEHLEWRISPSLSERSLMFSMNITHIRCYVVLKMIVKYFIKPRVGESISSFQCKTVLFWCIASTSTSFWKEDCLLACILYCLNKLRNWIQNMHCPLFMIPEENMFVGKVHRYTSHSLIQIITGLILSEGRFLLRIPVDDVGQRLAAKCIIYPRSMPYVEPWYTMDLTISDGLAIGECLSLNSCLKSIYKHVSSHKSLVDQLHSLDQIRHKLREYTQGTSLQQQTAKSLLLFLYATSATLTTVKEIQFGDSTSIPPEALVWLSLGENSDVSSSRLKHASLLYCIGDLVNAALVLDDAKKRYDIPSVEPVCGCYTFQTPTYKIGFSQKVLSEESTCTQHTAFCVRFFRSERLCAPKALQYEMFRSVGDDTKQRQGDDDWMNWAVADSLPFLYFLQFMIYRQMGRRHNQYLALNNLVWSIMTERNLGHRETAFNLLGQCLELEDRADEAFHAYRESVCIRQRNNAANWLMCCMLAKVVKCRNQ